MIFFGLAAVVFCLICIGAGIVLAAILALILFGFIAAGILSTSMLVGLQKKSLEKGFFTFWTSSVSILGAFLGTGTFYFLNRILHWNSTQTAILSGFAAGLLSGCFLAIISFYIFKRILLLLKNKFNDF
jgi:hypothetical protein